MRCSSGTVAQWRDVAATSRGCCPDLSCSSTIRSSTSIEVPLLPTNADALTATSRGAGDRQLPPVPRKATAGIWEQENEQGTTPKIALSALVRRFPPCWQQKETMLASTQLSAMAIGQVLSLSCVTARF